MTITPANFVAPITLGFVVVFGVAALYFYKVAMRTKVMKFTTEFFLTARNSQPWYRVAFGFWSTAMGANVIFSVSSYITDPEFGGGVVGMVNYAFFAGFALVVAALVGVGIKTRFPQVLSIGSFARWRFGKAFQAWVTFNVLCTLGINLTVEYTAIGALYTQFLDQPAWVPILVVSVVTMIYTTAGGLYISLLTDYVQSIFILLLLVVVGIFIGVNFRTGPLPPLPPNLAVNEAGLASFMTLGVALIAATFFSDAVWQRVWSAQDNKALIKGSMVGGLAVFLVTLAFGLGAFFASWAGLVTSPNVAFFELLKTPDGVLPIGMLLVVCLIMSTMNEAAVDSFQIAIGDTLISLFESFGLQLPLWAVRALLALLNIPFAIIGCLGFNVISLYLITNLMATCVVGLVDVLPLSFGMIPQLDRVVTGAGVLFGSFFALFATMFFAVYNQVMTADGGVFHASDIGDGLYTTFYVVYGTPCCR
ncbi:hypothetical protein HDU91_001813 [Kappamyces sp. JEL0680]|nr:hypothetical protein HDU91_001813 [Kappamyces sp. JEL0680]